MRVRMRERVIVREVVRVRETERESKIKKHNNTFPETLYPNLNHNPKITLNPNFQQNFELSSETKLY